MPVPGVQTAVSGYEHLNAKYSSSYKGQGEGNPDNHEDDDFLPLKPPEPAHVTTNKSFPGEKIGDMNNSNNVEPAIKAQTALRLTELLHDFGQLQSASKIPEPMAWSPSMSIKPNPSLFVTPQKSIPPKHMAKETLLELQNISKIPQPMAWSPGMMVRPDPSVFVTPDKSTPKAPAFDTLQMENSVESSLPLKSTLGVQDTLTKSKEKYSVRFDLPSASSGDDTMDPASDCESPITLKGSEVGPEGSHTGSPVWKTFSPQKTYNPSAYSDESSLEESILDSLPWKNYTSGLSNTAALYLSNQNDFTSHIVPEESSSTYSLKSSIPSTFGQSKQFSANVKGKVPLSGSQKSQSKSKSASSSTVKSKAEGQAKGAGNPGNAKSGPQFIKSVSSPYEPPPPGLLVVREAKNNFVSTEYSYPFSAETPAGESEYEHTFARPEFNSTLRVRSELDHLCQQEVDVQRAVETTLAKSEIKRTQLNEKAASRTNCATDQFSNLVQLDTSVGRLCEKVVRMRTSKAPAKKKEIPVDKKPDTIFKPPDLMEFFTPNLQKESPDLSLPGQTTVTPQLKTASHHIAFDLYRHNRAWLGVNDF